MLHTYAARYYIVGCDTYVNVDYALRMLDDYDPSGDWWVTKSRYPVTAVNELSQSGKIDFNLSDWPNRIEKENSKVKGAVTWSSGGWGWFLSNSAVKAFANALDGFIAKYNPKDMKNMCYCPDRITGAILSLLGIDISQVSKYWAKKLHGCAIDSATSDAVKETSTVV